jgi:hypothetical protein
VTAVQQAVRAVLLAVVLTVLTIGLGFAPWVVVGAVILALVSLVWFTVARVQG